MLAGSSPSTECEVRALCVSVTFFQASWKHQPCLAQRLDDKKALNP